MAEAAASEVLLEATPEASEGATWAGSGALTWPMDISVTGTATVTGGIAMHGIPTMMTTTATVMTTTATLAAEGDGTEGDGT
jgi:hypothetical protein